MKYIHLLALGFFLGNLSCSIFRGSRYRQSPAAAFEVCGHRGEAGNYPENSIPGFLTAVKSGVQALEMDVVISADKKVVVSHEAFMASEYMSDPQGKPVARNLERSYNLYTMDYDSIRKFDGGSRKNRKFPKQKKIKTYKPLLEEVIDRVEGLTSSNELSPVKYMIEIKSDPQHYNHDQPEPPEFVNLVMEVVRRKGIEDRAVIKSFDPQILNILNEIYPSITVSYLVRKKGIARNLSLLNFTPDIYGPHYKLIKNTDFVDSVHTREMKLIPWTVNKKRSIKKMIRLGVDGLVTDYPERVMEILNENQQ